ncbi:MAG: class D sortase [Bryobacteraceae bacterium]
MRLVVTKAPLRQVLEWTRRMLVAGVVSMLGYCGFVLGEAWLFQNRGGHELERRLHDQRMAHGGASFGAFPVLPEAAAAIAPNGLIGRIEVPRIGLSAVVFEGTGRRTLRRAVGHIPGTPLPGAPGNIGLTGHRDTFFRPLRNVRPDDIITLHTLQGNYRYRVMSTRVVSPRDVAVLDPSTNEILTLVTCHPFYFAGPAPDRFIVRAERVTERPGIHERKTGPAFAKSWERL